MSWFYKQRFISVINATQIMKRPSEIDYKETIKTRPREVQWEHFILVWIFEK